MAVQINIEPTCENMFCMGGAATGVKHYVQNYQLSFHNLILRALI